MSIVKEHLTPEVSYLAYLPLAHIFEFVFEHAVMMWGGLLGYGSVRTLSATNCRNCKGDIQEFKPVFLVGVPAVWETIKKGILANLAKASKPVQNLFWSAYALKK
jgi:long-chain acyl-CoA synthetase